MRLGGTVQNRITLLFEYWRQNADAEELIARGEQVIACMRREGKRAVPTPIPVPLREALKPYA
jgi:enediyne biosynthesis thioesterase